MSQSPGMIADGRLLGLGCSRCASLGGGDGGVVRIGVFGCAIGAPRRRGTGTFSRWPFSVGGWVAGLDAGLMGRENEPVPGDHRGWASIGARMFALYVPWVAVMAGLRGLGFSDVRLLRPGGGGQAHFPAGFSSAGGGLAGLDAGLMGRENEPVPGDDRGWASIGSRMFALCVPGWR